MREQKKADQGRRGRQSSTEDYGPGRNDESPSCTRNVYREDPVPTGTAGKRTRDFRISDLWLVASSSREKFSLIVPGRRRFMALASLASAGVLASGVA